MRQSIRRSFAVLAATTLLAVSSGQAIAQDARLLDEQVDDFIHYVLIDNEILASANARALLDAGLTDEAFVDLIERNDPARFDDAIRRAAARDSLADVGNELLSKYNQGRLDRARNPDEVARNIQLLTGDRRAKVFASDRLFLAGEYAVPQLLQAMIDRSNPQRQGKARETLVRLARQAIVPLVTALPELDSSGQLHVLSVLGDISYSTSVPFIYDLASAGVSEDVRSACQRAVLSIEDVWNPGSSLAVRYVDLATRFYEESPSLTSFPADDQQLLWDYEPSTGLIMQPVPTSVYHEAMAMRLCERALVADSSYSDALSLWIAANFSREIDLGDETDAIYDKREPMYYAVAAGSVATQPVLAMALEDSDTQLALRAIDAIEDTAGGQGLWGVGAGLPLVDALRYPDRRVQYEAAIAIGGANPRVGFEGSDRVVPILASAIRDVGERFAVVVAGTEDQGPLVRLLSDQGYSVLAPGRSLSDVQAGIAEAPGVDLLVVDLPAGSTDELVREARLLPRLRATPILALIDRTAAPELVASYARDRTVSIVGETATERQIIAEIEDLEDEAVGGRLDGDQIAAYKERSLDVLRDLAVGSNDVLQVIDASRPLIAAFPDASRSIKMKIASVLAHIDSQSAQVKLMDEALDAPGDERIELFAHTADSVKRWGNLLDDRQVTRLVRVALDAEGEEATAAAALMGALDLSNDRVIPLILGQDG